MKVVILAGGLGTRISEESHLKPKPMIEIGGKPILWHIMKEYSFYGFNEFIICAGYKQNVIKEWFNNYYLYNSDITFDFTKNNLKIIHNSTHEPWKVTIVNTGLNTMTGGRIKRISSYVNNEAFMLTYGDGVSDINIDNLLKVHNCSKKIVTISTVNIGQQFGVIELGKDDIVTRFREKSDIDGSIINIGYMVCEPDIFDYIEGDEDVFEKEVLGKIVSKGELKAYRHNGFWKCMDTARDKMQLEEMILEKHAPWMVWEK